MFTLFLTGPTSVSQERDQCACRAALLPLSQISRHEPYPDDTLCLLPGVGTLLAADVPRSEKPNIIVIFTDDHGYSDLGSQGIVTDLKTPHTDALAASGVRMTNGYVTAPQCVPSRCGLLSGQYQTKLGVESNSSAKDSAGLEGFNRAVSLAERLKQAGYATGMAGKWHLGPETEIVNHGFDKVFPKNSNGAPLANITPSGQDQPLGPFQSAEYHLDACSSVACSFIERHQSQPFFFYLAYRAPHVPLDAPQKYLDRFPGEMPERRRKALAMITAVDDGVGRITETLDRCRLTESTLIFYIGDNGAPLKIHKQDDPGVGGGGWNGSLNEPLNGEKGMLSEGGIRVPFLVSWKGVIPSGQVYDQPVISLDVAATANALAGLDPDPALDGVNLLPYLTGQTKEPPHESLYWRWEGQAAIRQGDWKYLEGGGRRYLFNLAADVGESSNLIAQEPDRAVRMRDQLETWSRTLQPPGLKDPLSAAAERYFDWYLDGRRGASPNSAGNAEPEKPETPDAAAGRVSLQTLFNRRDTNKDGDVSLQEFLNGRDGETGTRVERRFKTLDRDGDGIWSSKELRD